MLERTCRPELHSMAEAEGLQLLINHMQLQARTN